MANIRLLKRGLKPKQRLLALREAVDQEVQPVLNEHISLRDEATQGWSSRNKPRVTKHSLNVKNTNAIIRWEIRLRARNAEQASVSVYRLVSDGTDVRHARMAFPYNRKTRAGQFGQFGNGGRVQYISKKFRGRDPETGKEGILARTFDERIEIILRRKMAYRVKKGLQRGLRNGMG